MIIAKISRSIENLTSKKTQVVSRDHQTNSDLPAKERPLRDIISEVSSDSDGIQEEVAEPLYNKQSKISLKQQLEQVQLQKKLALISIKVSNEIKICKTKISIPRNFRNYGRFDFKWTS